MKLAASLIAVAFAQKERSVQDPRSADLGANYPCGGTITGTQTIKSPGFDDFGYYFYNQECIWVIDMPKPSDRPIALIPNYFWLESTPPSSGPPCSYDFLQIFSAGLISGPYCGSSDPSNEEYSSWSLTDTLYVYHGDSIWFNSDTEVVKAGFEIDVVFPDDGPSGDGPSDVQDPAAFWANFDDFYLQTKAQMEAGDRPWRTPFLTWAYNQIISNNIEAQSQLEGNCTWATETANQHPTYEPVTVVSFNADDDRCINLMNMANMGLDYIDSYVCMTGHAKPRGTLQRFKQWMTSIRTLGEYCQNNVSLDSSFFSVFEM